MRGSSKTGGASRTATDGLRIAAVALACLVVWSALAAPATGAESPVAQSDEQRIEAGTEYSGTLDAEDSRDVYTFSAEEGEYLRVTTRGASENVEATLYGPGGEELGALDLSVENTPIGAVAPGSGDYRLVFEPADGQEISAGSDYGYAFMLSTAAPDAAEPNDRQSAATQRGSTTATTSATLGEGDTDWYAVEVGAGATVAADLDRESTTATNDVTVAIVDADGERLAETETDCTPGGGPCDPPELRATVDQPGTYYVQVTDAGLEGYIGYTLRTEARGSETTEAGTPNGTATTAGAANESATTPANGSDPERADGDAAVTETQTATETRTAAETPAPTETQTVEAETTSQAETTASPEEASPTATAADATATSTPTATDDGTENQSIVSNEETTTGDGPGFTPLGALVAAVVAVGALVARRRD